MAIKMVRGVPGELHAYGKVWPVRLNLVVIAICTNQPSCSVIRAVMRTEPSTTVKAPDGPYELKFMFNGRKEDRRVRVERGDILSVF
jgi:hypothetical protein